MCPLPASAEALTPGSEPWRSCPHFLISTAADPQT